MADSPRVRLLQLRIVLATWVFAGAANAASAVHNMFRDRPFIALPNACMVVFAGCLYWFLLRPRLLKTRASIRRQEAVDRQARIAELEKELGIDE